MGSRFNDKFSRLILRFRGKGATPLQRAETAIREKGLRVIDQSARMLLLEGETTPAAVDWLKHALPDWSVSEEKNYSVPKPTPRVKLRTPA